MICGGWGYDLAEEDARHKPQQAVKPRPINPALSL